MSTQQQDEKNPGAHPVDMEGDMLIQMVQKATSAITTRLQSMSCHFKNKICNLIFYSN